MVVFYDIESRDLVAAHSKHLSSAVDDQGNPTAGLRMDIPLHLMSTFKLLEAHGHKMRMRYGSDFKRHVRFDDGRKSLYLNVRLPGERLWTRISPDFAGECAREMESSDEMKEKFGLKAANGRTAPDQIVYSSSNRRPRSLGQGRSTN